MAFDNIAAQGFQAGLQAQQGIKSPLAFSQQFQQQEQLQKQQEQKIQAGQQGLLISRLQASKKLLDMGIDTGNQELLDLAASQVNNDPLLSQTLGVNGVSFKVGDTGDVGVDIESFSDVQKSGAFVEQLASSLGRDIDIDSEMPALGKKMRAALDIDPNTPLIVQSRAKGAGKITEANEAAKRPARIQAKIDVLPNDFLKRKRVDSLNSSLSQLEQIKILVETNNPLADRAIPRLLARAVGDEVGVMTNKDVRDFGGSKQVIRQFERLKSVLLTGLIPEEDREDILELLEVVQRKMKADLEGEATAFSKSSAKTLGISEERVRGFLQPELDNILGTYKGFSPPVDVLPKTGPSTRYKIRVLK